MSGALSNAELERLAMLAEEAGEIVQAVGKIVRHGYDSQHPDGGPDNRATLHREVADLVAVVNLMQQHGDLDPILPLTLDAARRRKLRYAHHQTGQALAPTPGEEGRDAE